MHALPDEAASLRDSFSQAREDMSRVRELQADEAHTKVTRRDVAKYMVWRYGVATPYQVGDDLAGLPTFMFLKENFGTPIAYVATNLATTGIAFTLAMGERRAQFLKADAQNIETAAYRGPLGHAVLDASVNSSPWNVMRTATRPRKDGEPVELMTPTQILVLSQSYGAVNTAFYAGSTAIPGLNSWTAFGVSLAVMYQIKGTIRGYQERMAEQMNVGALER
jgi:hypothetical protein